MAIIYPAADEVHIFSSHAWKYGQHRDALHRIIEPVWIKGVDYHDRSITWRHPLNTDTDPELAYELRDIIAGVDALVIMAGMYANNRPWMMFEIHAAFALGVPIIPILRNGQEKVPQVPTRLASCAPVRWRGDSIREAILSVLPIDRRRVFEAKLAKRAAVARAVAAAAYRSPPPRYQNYLAGALEPPRPTPSPFLPQRRNALADALGQIEFPDDGVFGALGRYRR